MPAVTVPIDAIALGPGFLYWAPLLSTLPANTVVGSKFTDTWPGAWLLFGATDDGSEFSYKPATDDVEVAEYYDPVAVVSTGREISITFDLAQIHATNFKRVLNGGTVTTSGSGSTLLSEYTPPDVGAEVRAMVGWESQDSTERLVMYQCFQTGDVKITRKKGANKATLPTEFRAEKPSGNPPFKQWFAGSARG
jgi:hypothetical protein